MKFILKILFIPLLALNSTFYSQSINHYVNSIDDVDLAFLNQNTKNFIEVSYGVGQINRKGFTTSLDKAITKELKFGKRYQKYFGGYRYSNFSDNYIFTSYIENENKSEDLAFELWRFGLGYNKGIGYNFSSFEILPYYQIGFSWTKSNFTIPNYSNTNPAANFFRNLDYEFLKKFNNNVKFGTVNNAGIDLKLGGLVTIGGSYEMNVIFPQYLFAKHFGSFLIETLASTSVDYLTEGVILRYTPVIAPIFNFLLKNGLTYYFFTLKKENMNWPFKTSSPLTLEMYKINLQFTF